MRALSIAVCLSVAASLAACEEEPATLFPKDAGATDAGAGDAGRDGGSSTAIVGMDSGVPAALPVENDPEDWTVLNLPDGGENPAMGITGSVRASAIDGGTKFKLEVSGLAVPQAFGAHLHQQPCASNQGGGHYQNIPAPMGQANDPQYANPQNEVWLDFTAVPSLDDPEVLEGISPDVTVKWVPRKGQAGSIVVHERATGDGGVAGTKLACTNMSFDK